MGSAKVDPPLLQVESVSCGSGEVRILEEITFSVRAGDVMAVLGANGEGKSTLFKSLAGLTRPHSGQVLVGGHILPVDPIGQGLVGVVLENLTDQFIASTVGEEAEMAVACSSSPPLLALDSLLESMGLRTSLKRSPHSLSGGEQARLLIALAVLRRPQLLLLDDPFVFLGWPEAVSVLTFVNHLVRTRVVEASLFTTTECELALFANSVLVLHNKRVCLEGSIDQLFTTRLPPGVQRPLAQRCARVLPHLSGSWTTSRTPTEDWGKRLAEDLS